MEDGINEVRSTLRKHEWYFDAEKCVDGVDALMQYRWKLNKQGLPTKEPEHDMYSHGSDAFRTGAMMADLNFDREMLPGMAQSEYDIFDTGDNSMRQQFAYDGDYDHNHDHLRHYG